MLRLCKILIFITLAVFSIHSFAESNPKKYGSINTRWEKPILIVCLDPSAYSIKNIGYALDKAMVPWNQIKGIPKLVLGTYVCDMLVEQAEITYPGLTGALAITSSDYYNNGVIKRSLITISSRYKQSIGNAGVDDDLWDLQSILVHEFGHAMGLDEDYQTDLATMSALTPQGTVHRRKLNKQDVISIQKLYGVNLH